MNLMCNVILIFCTFGSLNVSVLGLLIVDSAGTVFAYGVTSSGKTHTMHVSYWILIILLEV